VQQHQHLHVNSGGQLDATNKSRLTIQSSHQVKLQVILRYYKTELDERIIDFEQPNRTTATGPITFATDIAVTKCCSILWMFITQASFFRENFLPVQSANLCLCFAEIKTNQPARNVKQNNN
jgi:hypothetical protein